MPAINPTREALPAWANELSEKYYSGVTSMFVLHGNVRDLALARQRVRSALPIPPRRPLRRPRPGPVSTTAAAASPSPPPT